MDNLTLKGFSQLLGAQDQHSLGNFKAAAPTSLTLALRKPVQDYFMIAH